MLSVGYVLEEGYVTRREVGGGLGGGLYSAASADGAQKVGYDSIGRIGSFFTPFVGLATPNKINPNRK